MWYHALCVTVHLETGFIVESMEKCNKFLTDSDLNVSLRDPSGLTRLIICKWVWELRNENWETANIWQKLAWSYRVVKQGEKLSNLISGLYLIEGLIIFMVNKMDMKNYKAARKAEAFIRNLFRSMDKALNYCASLQPRLYHMKAYYLMAKDGDYKGARKLIKKGRKMANKQYNDLELDWMEHSEQVWSHKLPIELQFIWQERCEEGNTIQITDLDYGDKVPFSLPLPIYL